MHTDLEAIIKQKAQTMYKKCALEGQFKIHIINGTTGMNPNTRILSINENLLFRWQAGDISENEVDSILAHEFGHLISHPREGFLRKSDVQCVLNLMVLVALVSSCVFVILNFELGSLAIVLVIIAVAITIVWGAFLPFVLRKIYLSDELAADKNAIKFSLITDEQMAKGILNRKFGKYQDKHISPFNLLRNVENFIEHPSINEQLANIGFEVEKPVNATFKRTNVTIEKK